MTARDWDARTYERVSGPQARWAEEVLDRLPLEGGETVLDAGCGTGRVTRMLLERLPDGHVVAVDAAPSMVAQAREALDPARTTVFQADLAELVLEAPVDAAFSNAVFHWVPDHDALFARMFAALRPGGRLIAQCGGQGNVERFHEHARAVGERAPYAEFLAGWTGPWNFASPDQTAEPAGAGRLRGGGDRPRALARDSRRAAGLRPHRLPGTPSGAAAGGAARALRPRPSWRRAAVPWSSTTCG